VISDQKRREAKRLKWQAATDTMAGQVPRECGLANAALAVEGNHFDVILAAFDLVEDLLQLGLAAHKVPGYVAQLIRQRICAPPSHASGEDQLASCSVEWEARLSTYSGAAETRNRRSPW
jgi:hypothetical protein